MNSKQVKKLNVRVNEALAKPLIKAPAPHQVSTKTIIKATRAVKPTLGFQVEPGMPGFNSF